MSQTELGSYLSISRENVSRQLGRLRDANVITVNDQQNIITDEEGLAEIAANPSKD
jgi:CRP-like cAMP-binding protein